jgi:L-ribulose-5-phosphate 3-epimerase
VAGGAALCSAAISVANDADKPRIRKAVKYHMVTAGKSVLDKFKIVKDVGFDGIEIRTRDKVDRAAALKASLRVDLPIHGVINSSDPDIKTAVELSKYFGGTSVLVVAGRVSKTVSYDENYRITQDIIRRAIPAAEKHGIRILVENVWNNFLLSPMEMARYLDELDSAFVGAYFDIGNVVRFGFPDQWIRILGKRIGKLDVKEYSRELQKTEGLWKGFNVEIGDGDADYASVRKALSEIGYVDGWATAEVKGGDRQRLQFIADRMDRELQLKGH